MIPQTRPEILARLAADPALRRRAILAAIARRRARHILTRRWR